jgi:hypothetical protein
MRRNKFNQRFKTKSPRSIVIIKDKSRLSIIISIISICISLFAVYLTYRIAYPKDDLKIQEVSLLYDPNSFLNKKSTDSLFVFIDFYNNGNKPVSISSLIISCSDTNKTFYKVALDRIYLPIILNPGAGDALLYKFDLALYNYHVKKINDLMYKFKFKQSDSLFIKFLRMAAPFKYQLQRELISPLILKSTIYYNNKKEVTSTDTIINLEGINLKLFLNERRVTNNH